jgi:hypothetical protein
MPIDIYKATTFLNVDLDLYSRSNLQPLVAASLLRKIVAWMRLISTIEPIVALLTDIVYGL